MIIKLKLLSKMKIKGVAIYPFIFINPEYATDVVINHERIHIAQQKELLVIPFYIIYLLNWIINIGRYFIPVIAYRRIIFEKEAKYNENNLEYLKDRKIFNFIKYVSSKNCR
jgi:hypothetical protein